jgi:hypothetical protein
VTPRVYGHHRLVTKTAHARRATFNSDSRPRNSHWAQQSQRSLASPASRRKSPSMDMICAIPRLLAQDVTRDAPAAGTTRSRPPATPTAATRRIHRRQRPSADRRPNAARCEGLRRRGQRTCGQPDREGELPTRGHREGTVTQPIRYSQYRGAGLCWVGGAASGHCRPIVAPMRACAKSKGPGTLTSTELQVLPWRHDLQTTRDRVPPQR